MPETIDHILVGKFERLLSFLPKKHPNSKKNIWKKLTKNGNNKLFIPIILPPIPMQTVSIESAKLRNKASLLSILFDLSKSEDIGFLIIFIVIPRNFIKNEYVLLRLVLLRLVFLIFFSFFRAWKQIKIPIRMKIKLPK